MDPSPDPTEQPPQNQLRLDRCPECGYLLAGLPEAGQCPECGVPYDPSLNVLYGYGFGAHQTVVNTRANPLWQLFAGSLIFFYWGLRGLLRHSWWAIVWLLFLVVTGVVGLANRRRVLTDAPAPSQLRLSPAGYAQRDGVGPARLRDWGNTKEQVRLVRQGAGLYRLTIGKPIRPLRLASTPRVEFEFVCSDETAGRLSLLIGEWRKAAGVIARTDAR